MNIKNLKHNGPFRKVSSIVGDCMGDFHPHGDASIAESLVRLGQCWSMMVPLIEPQGNFGSQDGDPPAAQRYIEAKLSLAGEMLLEDTVPGVVPFNSNYDGRTREPQILAGKFPNLLINGDYGIAVSLSSKIPPHNPIEVANAIKLIAKKPAARIDEVMDIIPGPDFPTGGTIKDSGGIREYFETGRGQFFIRANGVIKNIGQRQQIIINELPYQVTASSVIEQIVNMVKEKKTDAIFSVQDYSDSKNGLQIVIDLKSGFDAKEVLQFLFDKTKLQVSFTVNMNMLNEKGEPQMIGFIDLIRMFCDHRRQVIKNKILIEIGKNKERLDLLDVYRKMSSHIDKIINLVKNHMNTKLLVKDIANLLNITEEKAKIVADMPLKKISKIEREKVEEEYNLLLKKNKELESILESRVKINNIICKEMDEVIEACGKPRLSRIR